MQKILCLGFKVKGSRFRVEGFCVRPPCLGLRVLMRIVHSCPIGRFGGNFSAPNSGLTILCAKCLVFPA